MSKKRWGIWLVILAIFMQCFTGVAIAAEPTVSEVEASTTASVDLASVIDEAAKTITSGDIISDWAAIGLAKAGYDVPERYIKQVEAYLTEKSGDLSKVTDYERLALGVMAVGGDARQVAGYDLIQSIFVEEDLTRQGANGVIFALLVLQDGWIQPPAGSAWDEDTLITWLLKAQNDDGGWALVHGEESSIDITAMAVTSLAPYQSSEAVLASLIDAVEYLSAQQLDNGGFPGLSAESTAQVIIALSSVGLEVMDPRVVKAEGNALSYLLSLRTDDGGFRHLPTDTTANVMATEQALLALASIQLLKADEAGLYRELGLSRVEVQVEGPSGPIVHGEARGNKALEALVALLEAQSIPYEKEVYSYGTLVTTVDGIEQGLLGGYDGWYYAVQREGEWIFPAVGIDAFVLEHGDELLFYYSDGATQLVESVTATTTESGVSLEVKQATWDWTNNQVVVTPASGVTVAVGEQTGITDADGLVTLALSAGPQEVVVTGYKEGAGPSVARTVSVVEVEAIDVEVSVQVEGATQPLASGSALGDNALEALERFLAEQELVYETTVYSFGTSIDSVDGLASGSLGGWDGWMYAVKRGDAWIHPAVSLDAFTLESGDHVVLYYGDGTKLIKDITTMPSATLKQAAFEVEVTTAEWDWTANAEVVQPAAGVSVTIGDQTAVTNDEGIAQFEGLPGGNYEIVVEGYAEGAAPSVVRTIKHLTVSKP